MTREFVRYYEADPISNTIAFDGVADVVARFGRLGLKQGVCTNKFERPSRMILEHLKLMPPIADVAGADTFPVRKPDPRHILMLVARMGGDARARRHDRRFDPRRRSRPWRWPARRPGELGLYRDSPASELGAEAVIQRFDALPAGPGATRRPLTPAAASLYARLPGA